MARARAEDLEAEAARVAPWSSDPLDDVDWTRDEDGTLVVFPADHGL